MDTPATNDVSEEDIVAGDRIVAEDIYWDTDGADPKDLDLPTDKEITIPSDWEKGDIVADILSDEHGYCITGIGTLRRA